MHHSLLLNLFVRLFLTLVAILSLTLTGPASARAIEVASLTRTDLKIKGSVSPRSAPQPGQLHQLAHPNNLKGRPAERTGAFTRGLPGEPGIPRMIAQPDLPMGLRPPTIPRPRPVATEKPIDTKPQLVATIDQFPRREAGVPPLLPEALNDPGIVYILPFDTVMVPAAVQERIFDHFMEELMRRSSQLEYEFIILKDGLPGIAQAWLDSRQYVTGEIYGYVEEASCCATELRTRVRLRYFAGGRKEPLLTFEFPYSRFFEHDRSDLDRERAELADRIVQALIGELVGELQAGRS